MIHFRSRIHFLSAGLFALPWLAPVTSATAQPPPSAVAPGDGPAGPGLTLQRAVALALEQGPALVPLRGEVNVARARLEGASLLQPTNPEVDLGIGPRRRPDGTSMDIEVGVRQRLEIYGQRAARIDATRALLSSSEAHLAARRLELIAQVREAFGRALATEQILALAEQARALAADSLRAAEDRQAAGAASRIEVNTARGEVGRAIREWTLATQRRLAALADLRLLIGLDPAEEIRLVGSLRTTGQASDGNSAKLVQQALARRPEIVAARRELQAAQAERRLASREALPVPSAGATYKREEGAHIVLGTLSLDLPLFQRNQGERGVSGARVSQAEGALVALERAVNIEVRVSLDRYLAAVAAATAYAGGILSAVEENANLINEAYRAGKVDFFQLLVIRRESLDVRRGYIEALQELNTAEAQLNRAAGVAP